VLTVATSIASATTLGTMSATPSATTALAEKISGSNPPERTAGDERGSCLGVDVPAPRGAHRRLTDDGPGDPGQGHRQAGEPDRRVVEDGAGQADSLMSGLTSSAFASAASGTVEFRAPYVLVRAVGRRFGSARPRRSEADLE